MSAAHRTTSSNVRSVSDLIGKWSHWHWNVFFFHLLVTCSLPYYWFSIGLYDSDTNYSCFDANQTDTSTLVSIEAIHDSFNASVCVDGQIACPSFQYELDPGQSTLISDFAMVCDKEQLRPLALLCFLAGSALAAVTVLPLLIARHARRLLLRYLLFLELLANVALCVHFSVWMYFSARSLLGYASFGRLIVTITLLLEITDNQFRYRIFPHLLLGLPIGLGLLSFLHQWMSLAHIQYVLTGLTVVPILWTFVLPESPYWQLTHGQYEQAEQQLLKRARARAKLTEPQLRFRLQQLRERLIQDELDRVNAQHRKANRSCCGSCSCSATFIVLLLALLCAGVGLLFTLSTVWPSLLASLVERHFLSPLAGSFSIIDLIALATFVVSVHIRLASLYNLVAALFAQCVALFGLLIFTHLTLVDDRFQKHLLRFVFVCLLRASAFYSLASLCLYSAKRFRCSHFKRRVFAAQLFCFCVGAALSSFLPQFIALTDHCWTLFVLAILSLVLIFTVIWLPEPEATGQSQCTAGPLRTESMRRLAGSESPATHSSSHTPPPVTVASQLASNGHAIGSILTQNVFQVIDHQK